MKYLPPTLKGYPGLDELSAPRGRGWTTQSHIQVQCQASPVSGSATGPTLVGIPRPTTLLQAPLLP